MKRFQFLVHGGSLVPMALMVIDFFRDNLTVNPIQELTLRTGKTALILLILTLACTPINTIFKFRPALKARRALGLYAFTYASVHFLIFIGLDYQFNLSLLREAILEKRFALAGFAAFLILIPLALTSTRGWMRRLGKKWKRLHKMVYVAGILVIIHYVWLVKSDIRIPLLYGAVVVFLLIVRIPFMRRYLSNVNRSKLSKLIPSFRNARGAQSYVKENKLEA